MAGLFKNVARYLVILLVGLLPTAMTLAVNRASSQPSITVLMDGQVLSLKSMPLIDDGRLLVPIADVAQAFQVQVQWNATQRSVTVIDQSDRFTYYMDSHRVDLGDASIGYVTESRLVDGRSYVPLTLLAENLKYKVDWSEADRTASITSPPKIPAPARAYSGVFPARVAFTNDGHLWLVDGGRAGAAPVLVTGSGTARIIGWSHDGAWLMYMQSSARKIYSGQYYLWIVGADGTHPRQVDQQQITGTPLWSPTADMIAYSTEDPSNHSPGLNLKLATIEDSQATVSTLLSYGNVADYAWAPDGQSLAISVPRTGEEPWRIDRITLAGVRTSLYTSTVNAADDGIYPWAAVGFKWSPDGRYIAYFVELNSGSLSADGVAIQVLDLHQPGQPLGLDGGITSPEWLVWSADGSHLAYISGGGREATNNKHLHILNMLDGKDSDLAVAGRNDTQPAWAGNRVIFCRGPETPYYWDEGKILVPGQRIWALATGTAAQAITAGPDGAADYAPSIAPEATSMIFLRLNNATAGSLYTATLPGGPASELIRGLTGDPGFYGNYYPTWASIYWESHS